MQLLLAWSSLAALVAPLVAASPTAAKQYYLKTKSSGQFNGLYLAAYHSGAGFNDAVLLNGKTNAVVGFLNATSHQQQFSIEGGVPYSLTLQDFSSYDAWGTTAINVGAYANGRYHSFSIGKNGLDFTTSPGKPKENEFGGWLVCDWVRLQPQLFFIYSFDDKVSFPCSCEKVDLVPEYTS